MKRPKMYYSDNVNTVHVYDVVRIKRGYFKDKLAICTYVNFDKKELNLTIIDYGVDVVLSKTSVEYCYHNTKAAAKQWFETIKRNVAKQKANWSNIKYIKDHWNDLFARNTITARTIANIINYYIKDDNHAIEWLEYWADALNIIFTYNDADFCVEYINKFVVDKHYSDDNVRRIHFCVWSVAYSCPSPTGEQEKAPHNNL